MRKQYIPFWGFVSTTILHLLWAYLFIPVAGLEVRGKEFV
jgi:hypothetical protein